MHRLIRTYYRLFFGLKISSNVDFRGELPTVSGSRIQFGSNARVKVGQGVKIRNSNIEVIGGELVIEDGVSISDYSISVSKGCRLYFGANCVLEKGDNWRNPSIILWDKCNVTVANNNRLRCDVMCRFGGRLVVGEYNCINERTEIRCDEQVQIGSFNMISYNCRIWDTNTHSFYADDTRRKMTIQNYPNIGSEKDRPVAKPVQIADDCLLGEDCVVLKGSAVGNRCVIGARSVVAGKTMPNGTTAVGNPAQIK